MMSNRGFRAPATLAAVLTGLIGTALPAAATPISVVSYSMPNGDGVASGGSLNYWDGTYSGSGSKTVDGAPLSGGTGALTDGFVSTSIWLSVSNASGTGEYVGWYSVATPNPVVTFNFAGSPLINSISIQMDNSFLGGVVAPAAILVDGVSQSFTPPASGTVGSITLGGLSLTGNTHTIEFDQVPGYWTFISEVSFDGRPGAERVPEPLSLTLLGLGVAGLGLARRRRA